MKIKLCVVFALITTAHCQEKEIKTQQEHKSAKAQEFPNFPFKLLHAVVTDDSSAIKEYITENNARIEATAYYHYGKPSLLMNAAGKGAYQITTLLLENNVLRSRIDACGENALTYAISQGQKNIVALLLANNCEIFLQLPGKETIFERAYKTWQSYLPFQNPLIKRNLKEILAIIIQEQTHRTKGATALQQTFNEHIPPLPTELQKIIKEYAFGNAPVCEKRLVVTLCTAQARNL